MVRNNYRSSGSSQNKYATSKRPYEANNPSSIEVIRRGRQSRFVLQFSKNSSPYDLSSMKRVERKNYEL